MQVFAHIFVLFQSRGGVRSTTKKAPRRVLILGVMFRYWFDNGSIMIRYWLDNDSKNAYNLSNQAAGQGIKMVGGLDVERITDKNQIRCALIVL